MIRYACGIALATVLLVDAQSGWSQQYLYSPTPVGAEVKTESKEGILVQDIAVRKGDSLYKISRKFSGHGSYYPQILLFNDIKNPNRIYPGNVFKVPVSRNALSVNIDKVSVDKEKGAVVSSEVKSSQSSEVEPLQKQESVAPPAVVGTEIPIQDLKKVDAGKVTKKKSAREKTAKSASKQQHAVVADTGTSPAGQKLFEGAVKAYRQDNCRSALILFDKFLAENQRSPLAADASLYKAECYLKLSAQN